jgi:hypothetical protein
MGNQSDYAAIAKLESPVVVLRIEIYGPISQSPACLRANCTSRQFRVLRAPIYEFNRRRSGIDRNGLPHSEIRGSGPICGSIVIQSAFFHFCALRFIKKRNLSVAYPNMAHD